MLAEFLSLVSCSQTRQHEAFVAESECEILASIPNSRYELIFCGGFIGDDTSRRDGMIGYVTFLGILSWARRSDLCRSLATIPSELTLIYRVKCRAV